jgi:hypothetical protein
MGRWRSQRGAVFLEFAFVALLMYLLLAATVDFGRLFFSAQALNDAARVTAREISVIPLPADMTLTQALADPKVRQRVYQPEHLVIDLDAIPGGLALEDFLDSLPVLNQALRPLMIYDRLGDRRLLRYPGALVVDGSTPSGLTVAIPLVVGRDGSGVETIRWVPVIEEITNPNFPGESPFSLNTPEAMPQRGLVAVRINYPFQGALLAGHQSSPLGPLAPNVSYRIQADDGSVTQQGTPPGTLAAGSGPAGPYTGPYGLGKLYSFAEEVRPFRRLLSAQQVFRREVFD